MEERIRDPVSMMSAARIFLLSLLLLPVLAAHDLYLLPDSFHVKKGAMIVVAFHNGDAFPESEVAPVPERMKDPLLSGEKGEATVQRLRVAGKETLGSVINLLAGSVILSVHTAPNLIELAPDKFLEYLKEEGLNEVIDWRVQHGQSDKPGRERYSKYAKSLLQAQSSDKYYQHEMGFPLEIIPLADPYALHAGDKLPVRILFRGKPLAGLQLEAAWAGPRENKTVVIGRTGADGRIEVPLAQAGKWRLHSLRMERCSEPAVADWESFWASLTFEVR